MTSGGQSVLIWLSFLFALAIYFLPTLVAISRTHERQFSIALANLFLGWTVVGWVLAMVWAFSDQTVDTPEGGFRPGAKWTTPHLSPERLATILFLAVAAFAALVVFNYRWNLNEQNSPQSATTVASKSVSAPTAISLPPPDRIALADRACPLSISQKAILVSLSFGSVQQVYDVSCSIRRLLLDHMGEIATSKRNELLPEHLAEFRTLEDRPGVVSDESGTKTVGSADWIARADHECPLSDGQQKILASFSPPSIVRIYKLDCDLRRELLEHMATVRVSKRDGALNRHIAEFTERRRVNPTK